MFEERRYTAYVVDVAAALVVRKGLLFLLSALGGSARIWPSLSLTQLPSPCHYCYFAMLFTRHGGAHKCLTRQLVQNVSRTAAVVQSWRARAEGGCPAYQRPLSQGPLQMAPTVNHPRDAFDSATPVSTLFLVLVRLRSRWIRAHRQPHQSGVFFLSPRLRPAAAVRGAQVAQAPFLPAPWSPGRCPTVGRVAVQCCAVQTE